MKAKKNYCVPRINAQNNKLRMSILAGSNGSTSNTNVKGFNANLDSHANWEDDGTNARKRNSTVEY